MTLRLPPLVRRSPNPGVYLLYWAPFIATYQLVNRFPLRTPRELPLTTLDHWVPFVPDLLPLYVAYLPFYWWTVARSANDIELNRVFYAAHAQLLLSLPFFVLLPVRMPLEQFYPATPYSWADALWRWFDAPQNCFPSLHVSSCLLFIQLNWPRPARAVHTVLAAAIAASTVLVKQHYVVDVAGGVAVYFAARALLRHMEITGRAAPDHAAARSAAKGGIMIRRLMVTALVVAGLLAAAPARATTDVVVEGTFINDATGEVTRWQATVHPASSSLRGTVTFNDYAIPLEAGTVAEDQLMLQFTAPSGLLGVITGQVEGRRVSGVYAVGLERGTWTGTCDRAIQSE